MIEFIAEPNAGPCPGIVLRCMASNEVQYLRVTHVFPDCVYLMQIGAPVDVRSARRPRRISAHELAQLTSAPNSCWGHVRLPPALRQLPDRDTTEFTDLDHTWNLIKPLIKYFQNQKNLDRLHFTRLINRRATLTRISNITLRRILLRYYYFGGVKSALLPLQRGIAPASFENSSTDESLHSTKAQTRRGRKSANEENIGPNHFVVSSEDVADMVQRYKNDRHREGSTAKKMHEDYLSKDFSKRHPEIFKAYLNRQIPEPVTLRQFRYYTQESSSHYTELQICHDVTRIPTRSGGLIAVGPGEITEIDSTSGRIQLVSRKKPTEVIGTPTIYLAIDRWSRYITAAYISLRPPSYEELRYLLLIAMTNRESRFHEIDVNIDDHRWPRGRMSFCLCEDRGSENICISSQAAISESLRLEMQILPPACPDGKAIVERVIKTLKKRMAIYKGAYEKRPVDREAKKSADRAKKTAIFTLAEAFRILIEEVISHNNRPHRSLRRYKILTQALVEPTPQAAYLWGTENITGLQVPPLSDTDYQQLLLSTDDASIADGVITYKGREYFPLNREAVILASQVPKRRKKIKVRVDKSAFWSVHVPSTQRPWATFRMTEKCQDQIRGVSLDEEEALSSLNSSLWAYSQHEATRARVASALSRDHKSRQKPSKTNGSASSQRANRKLDSDSLKAQLAGPVVGSKKENPKRIVNSTAWQAIEREENDRLLKAIQDRRKRR